MKKVIILLLALGAVFTGFSQTALTSAVYPANALDTVTNTGTKYLATTQNASVHGFQKTVTIAVNVIKISGTVAGTLSLEGSLDGTNWYTLSATTYTALDVAAQAFAWSFVDFGSIYMRVKYVGTGTMVASFGAKYVARKSI